MRARRRAFLPDPTRPPDGTPEIALDPNWGRQARSGSTAPATVAHNRTHTLRAPRSFIQNVPVFIRANLQRGPAFFEKGAARHCLRSNEPVRKCRLHKVDLLSGDGPTLREEGNGRRGRGRYRIPRAPLLDRPTVQPKQRAGSADNGLSRRRAEERSRSKTRRVFGVGYT